MQRLSRARTVRDQSGVGCTGGRRVLQAGRRGSGDANEAAGRVGTFWLVLGGCGAAVLSAAFPRVGIGLPGVSLAFGLAVLTGAYAFGPISGGHFNR